MKREKNAIKMLLKILVGTLNASKMSKRPNPLEVVDIKQNNLLPQRNPTVQDHSENTEKLELPV